MKVICPDCNEVINPIANTHKCSIKTSQIYYQQGGGE
jgi:hypothetical protein